MENGVHVIVDRNAKFDLSLQQREVIGIFVDQRQQREYSQHSTVQCPVEKCFEFFFFLLQNDIFVDEQRHQ